MILKAVEENDDLRDNLSAAAHLIHGSPEDRFTVTYCPGHISREEIEGVGYEYGLAKPHGMDPLLPTPTELWNDVLDINMNSVYFFAKYAIPEMLSSGGGGSIVNVSSVAGMRGGTDAHAYAVSKAG